MNPGYGDDDSLLLDDPGGLTLTEAEEYQDALENFDDDLDGIEGYKTNGNGYDIVRLKEDLDLKLLRDKIKEIGYQYECLPDEKNPKIINTIGTPDIGAFGEGRQIRLDYGNAQQQEFRRIVIGSYLRDKYDNNGQGPSN